jgi:Amt family ammonium transporter
MDQSDEFRPHNPAFMLLGTLLLWVCWIFFNAGSVEDIRWPRDRNAPKVFMLNILAPSVSGIFCVYVKPRITGEYSFVNRYDIGTFCNGIIVGLVSVTASCDNIHIWAGPVLGLIGAITYSFAVKLMHYMHVDDPVEAAPLHFSGGLVGTLAVAIFD